MTRKRGCVVIFLGSTRRVGADSCGLSRQARRLYRCGDSQPTRLPLQLLCLVTSLRPRSCGTPYQNPSKGRTAEPHRDLVGAVLGARVAHLIDITRVASSHTDEVLIGPGIRHRRNHYSITVDVDIRRGCPGPGEVHRMSALHPAPMCTERDHARRRRRCRRYCWRWSRRACRCWSRRRCWCWCRTGLRAVSAAGVKRIRKAGYISTPDDHFIASPDRRVKVSCQGRIDEAGGHPTVCARIVSAPGIQTAAASIPAPDDHFTASPDRRMIGSCGRRIDYTGGHPTICARIISPTSV